MSSTDYNYKSNYDVNFETGSHITKFEIDTAIESDDYYLDPKQGEQNHMKLTIKETTLQRTTLKVETTTSNYSEKVVAWFKDKSFSAPTLSREKHTDWPPQMRFAFTPTISLSVSEGDKVHTFDWPGLTIGIDTVGRSTWWLSSAYIKTKEQLSVLGITIIDDVLQEVKLGTDLYCRLTVSVDGTHLFKVKAEIHKKSILDI